MMATAEVAIEGRGDGIDSADKALEDLIEKLPAAGQFEPREGKIYAEALRRSHHLSVAKSSGLARRETPRKRRRRPSHRRGSYKSHAKFFGEGTAVFPATRGFFFPTIH